MSIDFPSIYLLLIGIKWCHTATFVVTEMHAVTNAIRINAEIMQIFAAISFDEHFKFHPIILIGVIFLIFPK